MKGTKPSMETLARYSRKGPLRALRVNERDNLFYHLAVYELQEGDLHDPVPIVRGEVGCFGAGADEGSGNIFFTIATSPDLSLCKNSRQTTEKTQGTADGAKGGASSLPRPSTITVQ